MPFNPYFFLMFIIIIVAYIRHIYQESKEKGVTVLLLVTFKEGIEVPDFQRNRKMKEFADWEARGERAYFGSSSISGEQLLEQIMKEFNLSEDKISIYDPAGFYWGSYVTKNIRL